MYDFYILGQTYTKLLAKMAEPAFNNPLADWYMNQCMDAMLRCWFWHGPFIALQDQWEEFGKIFTAGNICRPQ